jgi:hypothetical protein
VLILVKDNIPYTPITLTSNLEATACTVHANGTKLTLASLYIPPNYKNLNLITDMDDLIQQLPHPFIITADSNAHHHSWGSEYSDARGRLIDKWTTENQLDILNTTEPTYLNSNGSYTHIDLTITTNDISPTLTWRPLSDTFNSDHFPILIGTCINCPVIPSNRKWNLKTANWTGYRRDLKLADSHLSPTQASGALIGRIKLAADKNIQLTKDNTDHKYCKYWWTPECSTAVRAKKKAYNKYKRQLGNLDLWIEYKKARAILRNTIKTTKTTSWINFVSTITSRTPSSEIWRKVKQLKGAAPRRRLILKQNDAIVTDAGAIAEIFAVQYSKRSSNFYSDNIFNAHKTQSEKYSIAFPLSQEESYNWNFTPRELQRALNSSNSRSPGPDTIPFEFFKQMNDSQKADLLCFYNYIWNTGLPHQWRDAIVIPIPKPGKCATNAESYRPIALTNCVCKIMERMVNWRLQAFLESGKLLNNCQSGFRAYHSTSDALVRLENSVKTSFIKGQFCIAVFLDITQAFDTVWHCGLIQKLYNLGLAGNLPHFISSFIKMRKISVKVNATCSNSYPLHSGVPQGSVLSPMLFNIMIDDISRLSCAC